MSDHLTVTDSSARERLFTAAVSLFARKGYAASSVREIVEAAGVTKPVLYYHFGDKEGLFRAIMEDAVAVSTRAIVQATTGGGSVSERIIRLFDSLFSLILENTELVKFVDSLYYGPPHGAPAFDFEVLHRSFQEALQTLVNEGIGSGEFRPGDAADQMYALLGAMSLAQGLTFAHPELSFDRERLKRVLEVIFTGIRAFAEPVGRSR